jgi:hypothetical protein
MKVVKPSIVLDHSDDELESSPAVMPSITVKKELSSRAIAKSSTALEELALLPVSGKVCV